MSPDHQRLLLEMLTDSVGEKDEDTVTSTVPVPETSDPAALIRHLEAHEPVKIALARDYPLVVQKLEKTAKGIEAMMQEDEGEEKLHKGLGWLHYRESTTSSTHKFNTDGQKRFSPMLQRSHSTSTSAHSHLLLGLTLASTLS